MTRLSRAILFTILSAGLAFGTGCSATGKFKAAGMPPDWDSHLPAPSAEVASLNTMEIRLNCPTMEDDDAFLDELSDTVLEQMRRAGMGEVKLHRRGDKEAHYEIVIYEAGEDGKFEFNKEAGVLAGIGGAAAASLITGSLGKGVAAGGIMGILAAVGLSEKKEVYSFAGVFRQRTSLSGIKTAIDKSNTSSSVNSGMSDRDTGSQTSMSEARSSFENTHWSYESKARERPFLFHIAVSGGVFSTKEVRDAAAREQFIKRFPKWATGGSVLGR